MKKVAGNLTLRGFSRHRLSVWMLFAEPIRIYSSGIITTSTLLPGRIM